MPREKTLVKNFIFNFVKTLNSLLFPVITFAYSSRVLGVDGVGRVNFAKSVITYFTMIAMLGMNYYGTREAAKLRNDPEKLSRFCVEMLLINGCTTLIAYALLAAAMLSVPLLRGYGTLLLICSAAIVLQSMGMEWLYQAMEEYRYIAIRSVLFQIGALAAMFIFVRDKVDVVPYAVVTVAASSGSYLLNFINARKYIQLHRGWRFEITKHLKPLLWLFAMAVSIELYTVLDTTMLGFIKGDTAVGLYTAAIKVERMVNSLITSIGVVLIPRLSFFIGQGEREKVKVLVDKAYNYVFMLSVPAAAGLFMLSDEIIRLFSGPEFAPAGLTMRIMTPIVILIPFSVVTNQQTFVPMGKEKLILCSTLVGAATNFTLNSILIPRFAENGAAAATVFAELAVAVVCFMNVRKYFDMKETFKLSWQYLVASATIPAMCFGLDLLGTNSLFTVCKIALSVIAYFGCLRILKNPFFCAAADLIKNKLRKAA